MSRIAFAFTAVFLTASAASAQASPRQPPGRVAGHEGGPQSLREACAADVKSLCGGVAPSGGKIMRCLKGPQGPDFAGLQRGPRLPFGPSTRP